MENLTTESYLNSNDFEALIEKAPFGLNQQSKSELLFPLFSQLHHFHSLHSPEYARIASTIFQNKPIQTIEDFPFLPVSIFKDFALKSIEDKDVFKVLTSSGTTSQVPSKIYLDADTAKKQIKVLNRIMGSILGAERLPMLIVDSKAVIKDRATFSARGAGILGMSIFGKDHHYLLNEEMEPDLNIFESFLEKYNGKKFFIFGFTYIIWQYLLPLLSKNKYDFSGAIMVHSGGWKKLLELAVEPKEFTTRFNTTCGMTNIYNFYGMIEQVGTVFLENKLGDLHCPAYSEIIIRNPSTLLPQPHGQEGLIQVLSCLPISYPGYSILTEDIGIITGEDESENAWKGRSFKILGRAKKAELRGCSDTFKQQ